MANIVGTVGDDILTGTSTIDTMDGLAGNDQLSGGGGNDALDGGDGDDLLAGGTGADSQQGGNGNDLFLIGSPAEFAVGESIDGAADIDTLRYTGAAATLTLTNLVTNLEHVQIATAAGASTGTAAININASAVGNALIMTGNNGANVLTGTAFDDTLTGNAGNDILNGGAGADQLNGGDGNDTLNGGLGDDQLIGGNGNDTYVVDSTLDTITETLTGGVDLVQSVITIALGAGTHLENLTLIGSNNIDGTGNELNNILIGNSGDNTLSGGDGIDQLIGNAGNDTLDGGAGIDRMAGGLGDDSYVVDTATDVVTEGRNAGTDTVSASVNHTLGANVENLTLAGGDLNGTGNTLNNVIVGTSGVNILSGLTGNDILDGGDSADQLLGGTGNDTLDGGMGQDSVIGGLGNDRIVMLVTAGDVDTADGGAGNDTLALSGAVGGTGVVAVDLSVSDQVTHIGGVVDSTLVQNNFENLDASGITGAVNVTGSAGNNSLIGSDGDDTLDGGNGNDTLNGGTGDDILVGGTGNDTYVVDSAGDVVDEALSGAAGGVDLVQSAITFSLASHGNVEHLTLLGSAALDGTGNALNNTLMGNSGINILSGDDGHDQLFGGAGDDTLNGEAGNDILNGEAGNDTLDGGIGTDTMAGGLGDDTYVVDAATDIVTEALNAGTDSVSASVNHILRVNVENLTLTGGALNGTGNNLENEITGTTGNNVLTGLAGDDTLDGGDGDDVLNGGTGADSQQGGNGNDVFLIGSSAEFAAGETIDGGADTDTLRYIGAAGTLTLTNLATNLEQVQIANAVGGTTGTAAVNINAVAVGNSLTIIGNNGANVLTGTVFDDTLTGNGGNDRLDGGTGDDTMSGGAGNDTYAVDGVGDVVDEALSGAAGGVDLVQSAITFSLAAHGNVEHLTLLGSAALDGTGNALNNTLTGNSGDNVLTGAAGNDTLTGNAGNDILDGGTGADRMAGGLGDDTYVIDSASDTVTEAFNAGTDLVQATVSKVLGANVEHLTLLGSAHLNGTGNTLNNDLTGNSGNNVLAGLAGADTLTGGDGNDTLDGGLRQDLVNGDAGDDRITMLVTAGNRDAIDAGADNDTLVLSGVAPGTRAVVVDLSQADQVVSIGGVAEALLQSNFEHLNAAGLSGFVTVTGSAGNNTLIGSSGNDSLDGGVGNDTMSGGRGNDTYTVDSASDVVAEAASAGIDKVFSSVDYTLSANVENLELTGMADSDGTGNTLANILIGNNGVNVLTGGGGNDTYVVQNDTDSVVEALNDGTDLVQSTAATFTLGANIEHLTLLGMGDIDGTGNNLNNILTGNSGDNVLTGAAGNDTLAGNAGNDILDGGAGADRMAGGLGDDTYVIDSASDAVTEALNAGIDLVQATVSKVLGANVEHLTLLGSSNLNGTGNSLDNEITGNSGNNRLTGMAGDDQLDGGDGDDILDGGAGIDELVGGLGNDTYVIDNLQDTLVELAGEGTDTVQINGSVDLNAGAFTEIEHIVLSGTGAFNATGDNGDNNLTGNRAANILTGNAGNDTLNGGAGNDQLIGGLGDDLLNGGTGADSMTGGDGEDTYVVDHLGDTITELAGEGIDQVQSSISHTLGSEVENLTLSGTGAINGTGNGLNNILTGNGGANALTGGVGNDVLTGGAGHDTLNGGADDDTLQGDAGNDHLVGDAGQDTVTGGLGDDRVTMLVTSGDVDDADGEDGNDTLALSGIVGGMGVVTVDLSANDQITDIGGVADSILTQSNFEHLDASGLGVGGSVNVTGSAGNNNLVGSSGNDSLDGGAGNDSLDGGSGNDTLNGGSGNDRLDGGTGNDTLTGGAGNDTYVVNSASDSITEALNGGTDVVESTASVTLGANVEHLTLLGSASLNGTGNGLDNVLTGNSGNNVLTGLAGADTLNGGDGNDTLNGGDGADTLTGGTGNDQLDGGTNNDQLVGGAGNDTFIVGAGDGQDLVQDNGGADRLRFESGSAIDPIDLVISRQANDLRIAVHGTSDHITIQNWYTSAASQVETIQAANGDLLLSSQVERLIQAMATFSATSGVSWDQALDNPGLLPAVQNIIAANWQ